MDGELKIEYLPISLLEEYNKNARRHKQDDVRQIANSIVRYGFNDPIGIWSDHNVIVEGHGRLAAAKKLGMETVPVVRLDHLTDEQRREYAIAHNRTAELSEWDMEKLTEELQELDFGDLDLGFDLDFGKDGFGGGIVEDDGYDADISAKPAVKLGDLYKVGRHFLLCGDSTKEADVKRLCSGRKIDLLITDPPYGVSYQDDVTAESRAAQKKAKKIMTLENDALEGEAFVDFLFNAFKNADGVMKPGAVFYIWYAVKNSYAFYESLRRVNWPVRQEIIWKKDVHLLGMQDYQWIHEPCQPAGTMVLTPSGSVPIEELKDGDRVVSYCAEDNSIKSAGRGQEIKTARREYNGVLYGIHAAGRVTWATDNHQFSVLYKDELPWETPHRVRADALATGEYLIPICVRNERGILVSEWAKIDEIETKLFSGTVYSLSVEKYEHYVSDGIVTHNCLYGWKDGTHLWASDRKQTTVLEFEKPRKSDIHPTMKPVPLFDYQMKNNTKEGDAVLDLFGGSGTTLVAAENNGRDAYMMELDPRYAQSIIERYILLTGDEEGVVRVDRHGETPWEDVLEE